MIQTVSSPRLALGAVPKGITEGAGSLQATQKLPSENLQRLRRVSDFCCTIANYIFRHGSLPKDGRLMTIISKEAQRLGLEEEIRSLYEVCEGAESSERSQDLAEFAGSYLYNLYEKIAIKEDLRQEFNGQDIYEVAVETLERFKDRPYIDVCIHKSGVIRRLAEKVLGFEE